MLNIKELIEKDIGRRIICNMEKVESHGKIKTWDDKFIYVIFDDWSCNEGFISEPVCPQYLTFV